MYQLILSALTLPLGFLTNSPQTSLTSPQTIAHCKSSPQSTIWPSHDDWRALNRSIGGCLIRTAPAASSCYKGNPFNSPHNCSEVMENWKFGAYHASWPESISYSIFTNNSCVPPGNNGYDERRGCSIGALPRYIVNATEEDQIAKAMAWASERDIRIVIKSTGHDFNGRATGAYSLLIWTHNFQNIEHRPDWRIPGSKDTADVLICGGGTIWASAYKAAYKAKRTLVGSEDVTVGLGGQISNGGHGILSIHHGLSSDQVLQATVITSEGRRLVANDEQNQDIFWAVRGAGGGQFGVVTEYVLSTHPLPENVVSSAVTFWSRDDSEMMEDALWAGFAEFVSRLPDLVDSGITGTVDSMSGRMAMKYLPIPRNISGPAVTAKLVAFNTTVGSMRHKLRRLVTQLHDASGGNLSLTVTEPFSETFWMYSKPKLASSPFAGASRFYTGRLLGRAELSDLPRERLNRHLRRMFVAEDPEEGTLLRFDIQAGPGTAKVPKERWASENWSWRTAYSLTMAWGAKINSTEDPSSALQAAGNWYEKNKEPAWRDWAPAAGAYMNAANGYSTTWKHDFYGDKYEKLLGIKQKYDPKESLWVVGGVGSDKWNYDLRSGLLCRADEE
ncbi:FAD binding, berberine domain-containing protein [Penicillium ucsense]|uniref:FAD binding, berberine domain-containing protein n=1 Tax=Penicillium ucsense TaxID=2839758 RepID=A0A8J8W8D8_9EURO|nr:FAD binding, berberine domain-containing protein [Penicillium ucsense]KAF7738715.1 FAD binding, berberine domain-containing protein [Penicillium ucsense]